MKSRRTFQRWTVSYVRRPFQVRSPSERSTCNSGVTSIPGGSGIPTPQQPMRRTGSWRDCALGPGVVRAQPGSGRSPAPLSQTAQDRWTAPRLASRRTNPCPHGSTDRPRTCAPPCPPRCLTPRHPEDGRRCCRPQPRSSKRWHVAASAASAHCPWGPVAWGQPVTPSILTASATDGPVEQRGWGSMSLGGTAPAVRTRRTRCPRGPPWSPRSSPLPMAPRTAHVRRPG